MPYTPTVLRNIRRWRGFYPYSSVSRRLVDLYNDSVEHYDFIKSLPKTRIKTLERLLRDKLDSLRRRWKDLEFVLNRILWLNWSNLDEIDYKRIKINLREYPIYEAWELSSVLVQIDELLGEIDRLIVIIEILKITIRRGGYEFNYYLQEDYAYRIYEDFPQYWVSIKGTPDTSNIEYGYKFKAMILVALITGKHLSMFKPRWKSFTVDELKIRETAGVPPSTYTRRLIYDTNNEIDVITENVIGGRWQGYIDFSAFASELPSKLDLVDIENIVRGYRHKTSYVSKIYE